VKKRREPLLLISLSLFARGASFLSAIIIYHLVSPEIYIGISWYILMSSLISLFAGLGFSNFLVNFILNPKVYSRVSLVSGIKSLLLMWIILFIGLNLSAHLYKNLLPVQGFLLLNCVLLEGILGAISIEFLYSSLIAKSRMRELIRLNLMLIAINGPLRIGVFLIFNESIALWAVTGVVFKGILVALFSRQIYTEIDFADDTSRELFAYKVNSGYLLFPIFSVGQWLTTNIDKYLGIESLNNVEMANYQLTFQFSALVGMVISQIDLSLLSNLFRSYSKNSLPKFIQLQMQASTFGGIAVSAISIVIWYSLTKDNSAQWIEIFIFMSLAQLSYVPVSTFSSITAKIKQESKKLFFAPYVSIVIVLPIVTYYFDLSRVINLAKAYFLFSILTMLTVFVLDFLIGEKSIFKAYVTPLYFSNLISILSYSALIYVSRNSTTSLALVALFSFIFSVLRVQIMLRRISSCD